MRTHYVLSETRIEIDADVLDMLPPAAARSSDFGLIPKLPTRAGQKERKSENSVDLGINETTRLDAKEKYGMSSLRGDRIPGQVNVGAITQF